MSMIIYAKTLVWWDWIFFKYTCKF